MELKIVLNRVEKHKGFVYQRVGWLIEMGTAVLK